MHEHIINTPIKDLPPLVEVIFLESMYFPIHCHSEG